MNSVAGVTGTATSLAVQKIGTFKVAGIESIHKRAYSAGVLEKSVITVVTTGLSAGDVIRLEIDVRLSQQTDSEYANSYLFFQKPVGVEVLYASADTTTTLAAKLVAAITDLKTQYGTSYISASSAGAVITIEANTTNQRIKSVVLSGEEYTNNSIITPTYTVLATGTVTVAGVVAFGDDNWMQRNVMLQTAENVRYFGMSKNERPILGGNYSQYTLRYVIDKDGQDGIAGGAKSITTHVFFVPAANISAFESEINDDAKLNLNGDSIGNSAAGEKFFVIA